LLSGNNHLIICDIIKLYGEKRAFDIEFMYNLFNNDGIINLEDKTNEYKISLPVLFDTTEISTVMNFVVPNFFCKVNGTSLINENLSLMQSIHPVSNDFLVRKTKLPEIYEIYKDEFTQLHGNNVLYISSKEIALEMLKLFENKNSLRMKCIFDKVKDRWFPDITI
jgi:hypothetical protein